MPSPSFSLNGGASGVKASVSPAGTLTATLDDIAGVRYVEWFVNATDETTSVDDYTLSVTAGAVPGAEETELVVGAAGTAGTLSARINSGVDAATGLVNETLTTATAKWYVPTTGSGYEVGVARENDESDTTFGWTGIINTAIRAAAVFASADVNPTPDTVAQRGSAGELKASWFEEGGIPLATIGLVRTTNSFVAVAARNSVNTGDLSMLTTSLNRVVVGASTQVSGVDLSVATSGDVQVKVNNSTTATITSNIALAGTSAKLTAGGVDLVAVTSGGVTVGSDSATGTTYRTAAANVHSWYVAGAQEMQLGSTGLIVPDTIAATAYGSAQGTTPATAGLVRAEKNTTAVAFRNEGNTANINAVSMSATNQLVVGDSTNASKVEYRVASGNTHHFIVNATTVASLSATGLDLRTLALNEVQDITFTRTATTPTLTQTAATSGAGAPMTIKSQDGFSTNAAGTLFLSAGTGGAPAIVVLDVGDDGGGTPGTLQFRAGTYGSFITVNYDGASSTTLSHLQDDLIIDSGTACEINLSGVPRISATTDNVVLFHTATRIEVDATGIGFFAAPPVAKPTVSGSRVANPALASLAQALANLGLINDTTTI